MDNSQSFSEFQNEEDLQLINYCPFCEFDLGSVKAKIIVNKPNSLLAHMQCKDCKGYVLIFVNNFGSIAMVTDLNYEDASNFYNKKPIKVDDVINIHQALGTSNIVKELIK